MAWEWLSGIKDIADIVASLGEIIKKLIKKRYLYYLKTKRIKKQHSLVTLFQLFKRGISS